MQRMNVKVVDNGVSHLLREEITRALALAKDLSRQSNATNLQQKMANKRRPYDCGTKPLNKQSIEFAMTRNKFRGEMIAADLVRRFSKGTFP